MNEDAQRIRDTEHLKLLSTFYYIFGGITAFFSFFPLIYVIIGVIIATIPESLSHEALIATRSMGGLMVMIGLMIFFIGEIFALLKIYAGYCLSKRKSRLTCLTIAAIICLGFPYSTLLGIFTFVVLLRGSVKNLFESRQVAAAGR